MSETPTSEVKAKWLAEALAKIMERRGVLDEIIRHAALTHLDAAFRNDRLEERVDAIIAGGWHRERARLFIAGAEWARRQFANTEPPTGFYHAMESEAERSAKAP